MSTFQRARTPEQRAERQRDILLVAATMLDEMPVSELSLNELSRRVGLAKSNVIRYFETREAVLLELLAQEARQFLDDLQESLSADVDSSAPLVDRTRAAATCLATTFEARPTLCELISAQAGVLEHNVSTEVALRYKQSARENLAGLAELLLHQIPELGEDGSARGARLIIVLVGAVWTQSHPAPTVRDAIETDPSLSFFLVTFPEALVASVETFLTGIVALRTDETVGP
ncbi:TetR/AcrR family transcriptional regulator [soil metagenome]